MPGLERLGRGEKASPQGEDWSDADGFNETFAQHTKGKVKDKLLHELDAAVGRFKDAATALPEDRFEDGRTAAKIMGAAGMHHFREHSAVVRGWRA